MLDTETVARHFAVNDETVRSWIRQGLLRGQRFNRNWRCAWQDVWSVEKGPIPLGQSQARYKAPLVTKSQIASVLGVSTRTVERLALEGLPTRKVFGKFRCNPADVAEWLQERKGFKLPDGWETETEQQRWKKIKISFPNS